MHYAESIMTVCTNGSSCPTGSFSHLIPRYKMENGRCMLTGLIQINAHPAHGRFFGQKGDIL